ncbi:MAG: hypothetical protein GY792_05610 [Gammaproteobacteria bacterium]|nr:hypothetical protein [Gammaproteobacteria bacterium]
MKHFIGIFTFPAVLVQAGMYRLMGVQCSCQWGDLRARPTVPVTSNQVYLSTIVPIVAMTILVLALRWMQLI